MMMKPITAFQNPATIQGKVTANSTSAATSRTPNPPGASASAASHSDAAIVATNSDGEQPPAGRSRSSSAGSACIIWDGVALQHERWRLLIYRQAVQTTAYNTSTTPAIPARDRRKWPFSESTDIASALWYCGPGQAEIRQEAIAPPEADEIRVRALYSAISRGTEALVFGGRVPESEFEQDARAVHGGRFSLSGKIWLRHGRAGRGRRRALRGKTVFALHPHQSLSTSLPSAAVELPEALPPQRAVLAANMETALNAVWDAAPGPSDRIAVVGAGVVGSLVAYLCGHLPGADVTLVDINPRRAELARALGVGFAGPAERQGDCDLVVHASGSPRRAAHGDRAGRRRGDRA